MDVVRAVASDGKCADSGYLNAGPRDDDSRLKRSVEWCEHVLCETVRCELAAMLPAVTLDKANGNEEEDAGMLDELILP